MTTIDPTLAHSYTPKRFVPGWMASPKYDGVRADRSQP